MTVLYLTEGHSYVSRKGETLEVRSHEGERRVIPLQQVTDVVCCGDVSWSGAALRTLATSGISIAYLDDLGRWIGRWEPAESKAVLLRRAQFRAADNEEQCIAIARAIVRGKLRNSRNLLLRAQVWVTDRQLERLWGAVSRQLKPGDLVRLYLLCGHCVGRIRGYGHNDPVEPVALIV